MFCVPITAEDMTGALRKGEKARKEVDLLEMRLDAMDRCDVGELVRSAGPPLMVTFRSKGQGGNGKIEPDAQCRYLTEAIRAGADYVDVEYALPRPLRRKILQGRGHTRVVLSSHFSDGTPSLGALRGLFREMAASQADVIKIVTAAASWQDNLRVLSLIPEARGVGINIIAFCMGPFGRISRVLAHLMGSYISFVTLEEGEESAPGQMTIKEMKRMVEQFSR